MIGLELGDNVAVAVALDERGAVRARAERPVADDPAAAALAAVGDVAAASDVAAVGVAVTNPESAIARALVQSLKIRYPTARVCDRAAGSGTAAAFAEAWIGAARDGRDVVYLAVADHTSAGVVRSGVPLVGSHGRGMAVGWLALNPVEREDYRKSGCLEAEVAAPGIVRRLVWRIKAGDGSRVQEVVGGDLTAITMDHVLDAARAGDAVSISVMRDTAKYIGMAAANLVVVAGPDTLVLGGIIASAADLLFEPVRVELARRLPEPLATALTVVTAALGPDAAAIGAARLAVAVP
jgi:predicted NBD/HSP70 family sugar kinase